MKLFSSRTKKEEDRNCFNKENVLSYIELSSVRGGTTTGTGVGEESDAGGVVE